LVLSLLREEFESMRPRDTAFEAGWGMRHAVVAIRYAVAIALIACAALPAVAQPEAVLKGVGGVRLEILGDDLPVPKATLQADVETQLRQGGVVVDPLRAARLRLLIAIFRPDGLPDNYIYSALLQLSEQALTRRGQADSVTWQSEVVLGLTLRNDPERFRGSMRSLVEEFVNAYLAANPK
jgi:hypothetical protein